MDHYFQMEQMRTSFDPMLEGYTGTWLPGRITSRIQLACSSPGVTYRHPGLLAKIVTTLDVLSEGRALFGIGASLVRAGDTSARRPLPSLGRAL